PMQPRTGLSRLRRRLRTQTWSWFQPMLVAANGKRLAYSVLAATKQPWLRDKLSNSCQRNRQRLPCDQISRDVRRHSQDQFKILAVAQGVIEGTDAVILFARKLLGCGGYR